MTVEAESRFEIINPSDKAFIEGDFKSCAIATMLYGGPAYGLKKEKGEAAMPITLAAWRSWFQDEFEQSFTECWNDVGTESVIEALESVELGWERTSLNDFTSRAHELADGLRQLDDEVIQEFAEAIESEDEKADFSVIKEKSGEVE